MVGPNEPKKIAEPAVRPSSEMEKSDSRDSGNKSFLSAATLSSVNQSISVVKQRKSSTAQVHVTNHNISVVSKSRGISEGRKARSLSLMSSGLDCVCTDMPEYWCLLTGEDKDKYVQLRHDLERFALRTMREHLPEQFEQIIRQILRYAVRGDDSDWKRSLVCGLAWLGVHGGRGAFAISTRHLRTLVGKCKASINAGFQALGYTTTSMSPSHASTFAQVFPFMRHSSELRQWTIRAALPESNRVLHFEGFPLGDTTPMCPDPVSPTPQLESFPFPTGIDEPCSPIEFEWYPNLTGLETRDEFNPRDLF
jgi:hypothetical protein